MENRQEDAMNLGGFLENFVLSNPFSNSTPKQDRSTTVSGSSPATSVCGCIVDEASHTDAKCGHVESNTLFAHSLEEMEVANTQKDLQKWLLAEYHRFPYYSVLLNNSELLRSIQKEFPSVTSEVLSMTMHFTFPDVHKVFKNEDIFWEGIIKNGESPRKRKRRKIKNKSSSKEKSEEKDSDRTNGRKYESVKKSHRKSLKQRRKKTKPSCWAESSIPTVENSMQDSPSLGTKETIREDVCLKEHITSHQEQKFYNAEVLNNLRLETVEKTPERDCDISNEMEPNLDPMPALMMISEMKQEVQDNVQGEPDKIQIQSFYSVDTSCDETWSTNKEAHSFNPDLTTTTYTRDMVLHENQNLKQHCRDLKKALSSAQDLVKDLKKRLERSQSNVGVLAEELSQKDIQLEELASEFLQLNEGFQRLSRRFHSGLQGYT